MKTMWREQDWGRDEFSIVCNTKGGLVSSGFCCIWSVVVRVCKCNEVKEKRFILDFLKQLRNLQSFPSSCCFAGGKSTTKNKHTF